MIPVVILSTVDPVLREAALLSLLTDLPGTAVLRQDLDPENGTLRRVVSDADGIHEDVTRLLDHACLGCAIREDSTSASRLTPVSMPISSHMETKSSVQTLPAAPWCRANGQPPRPATDESKRRTPIERPAKAFAMPMPRVS